MKTCGLKQISCLFFECKILNSMCAQKQMSLIKYVVVVDHWIGLLIRQDLNDLYVWFRFPYLPNFLHPTLNIEMARSLERKTTKNSHIYYPILRPFSVLNVLTKLNNISYLPTLIFGSMKQEPHIYFI